MNETKSIAPEDDVQFADAITDEALEAAARPEAGLGRAFTVAYCTGQAECPFWAASIDWNEAKTPGGRSLIAATRISSA